MKGINVTRETVYGLFILGLGLVVGFCNWEKILANTFILSLSAVLSLMGLYLSLGFLLTIRDMEVD